MSYTNKTTNLELPQYIGTDIPSILTDTNQTYAKIDTAYGEINNSVTEAVQVADQAKSLASAAQSQAQAASNEITALTSRVKTVETTLESTEEIAATAKSTAESAQSTANDATSAANTATSKAATAQSTANAAQSTANTANNLANSTAARVNNLKDGGSGLVASLEAYEHNHNVTGNDGRIMYSIENDRVTGMFLGHYQITTSSMASVKVADTDIYPLFYVEKNLFNLSETNTFICGFMNLYNNSTHAFSKYLPLYAFYSDSRTYFGVTDLSASDNRTLFNFAVLYGFIR